MIKEWINKLKDKPFKNYTHFDINKTFKTPQEKNIFFEEFFDKNDISKYEFKPFIRYEINEKRFTLFEEEKTNNNYFYDSENKGAEFYWHKEKLRPITYASHIDSYIYSYYSFLLGKKYESFLLKNSLEKNILAYRTVKKKVHKRIVGKNNIDFSLDIFQDIFDTKDCIVFAFDISGFFDTLDHKILKKELIKVLGKDNFSNSWYKIFKNITRFCYVDKKDIDDNNLIKRVNKKNNFPKIIDIEKFNKLKKEFKDKGKKLIKVNPQFPENNNKNPYKKNIGIPQGTPISGMLANLYMNNFDLILKKYVDKVKGKYYRYSDDILLIIPFKDKKNYLDEIKNISELVLENIKQIGLKINNSKTEISIFSNGKLLKNVEYIKNKDKFLVKNEKVILPFQYLGFTFDGIRVLIRNKTLSNYYKKLIQTLKRVYHLKDIKKDKNGKTIGDNNIKGNKILLGKYNRKYLYNGKIIGKKYKKENGKYIIDNEEKGVYLGFLSYGYNAEKIFKNFCMKNNIKNGIKKQLSGHKKKYNNLLDKYGIKS